MTATSTATGPFDASPPDVDGGDVGAEIADLAIENGESERSNAHEQRSLDEAAQERADDAQVAAMHDEASSMRTQGVFDATVGVVGACAAVAVPIAAPCGAGAAAGAAATTRAAQDASSSLIGAGGKLGDAFFTAHQHDAEANAAQAKAAADRDANDAKDASDLATDANANINTALDFARNYVSVVAETQNAVLHRA